MFSIVPSILTLDFEYFFGSFLTYWGPCGQFLGSGYDSKTLLGSTHVVQQLLFSIVPSTLTFDFDSILGSFLTFWGPSGVFLGRGWVQKTVLGSPHID